MISVFVLNFDFPKILCENMHSFGRKGKHAQRFLPQWFCKYKGVLSMKRKHMILLTGKAYLTEKVLWHYELNCQQNENRLKQT